MPGGALEGEEQRTSSGGKSSRDISVGIWSTAWWPFLRSVGDGDDGDGRGPVLPAGGVGPRGNSPRPRPPVVLERFRLFRLFQLFELSTPPADVANDQPPPRAAERAVMCTANARSWRSTPSSRSRRRCGARTRGGAPIHGTSWGAGGTRMELGVECAGFVGAT